MPEPMIDEIMRAPDYQIRAILIALCADRVTAHKATEHYQRLQGFDTSDSSRKRKAKEDVHVCVQCDEPFSEEDNEEGVCHYHPGKLEVDDSTDFWADQDEQTWGPIDTESNREEFPEGFIYDCCKKDGTSRGCEKGKHEAHPMQSQRGESNPTNR